MFFVKRDKRRVEYGCCKVLITADMSTKYWRKHMPGETLIATDQSPKSVDASAMQAEKSTLKQEGKRWLWKLA